MDKADLIDKIRKVCRIRNDIKIDMTVKGEHSFFYAKYVFLGETGIYVTDTLYIIDIEELDTESLAGIYQKNDSVDIWNIDTPY